MKKRKLRKIRLICFAFLLIFAITFIQHNFNTEKVVYTSFYTYTVAVDDTLWNISKEFNYNDQDIRQVVYDIQKQNQIGDRIYPGQVLLIPIDEKAIKNQQQEEYQVAVNP